MHGLEETSSSVSLEPTPAGNETNHTTVLISRGLCPLAPKSDPHGAW